VRTRNRLVYAEAHMLIERGTAVPGGDNFAGRHPVAYDGTPDMGIKRRDGTIFYPDGSYSGGLLSKTHAGRFNPDGTTWRAPDPAEASDKVKYQTGATINILGDRHLDSWERGAELGDERAEALAEWFADPASLAKAAKAKVYMDTTCNNALAQRSEITRLRTEATDSRQQASDLRRQAADARHAADTSRQQANTFTPDELRKRANRQEARRLRREAETQDQAAHDKQLAAGLNERTANNDERDAAAVPLDVPAANRARYWANYLQLTLDKYAPSDPSWTSDAIGIAIAIEPSGRTLSYFPGSTWALYTDGSADRHRDRYGNPVTSPDKYDAGGNRR
jgi:hypothetical protein